jgi:hypothetical protein
MLRDLLADCDARQYEAQATRPHSYRNVRTASAIRAAAVRKQATAKM